MAVRLQLEGIRCFSALQEAEIRPITLLVGENSSGKSTFLAVYRLAYAIANNLKVEPFFNEPPFLLGAYDQIASFRNGRAGRARHFSIGFCQGEDCDLSIRTEFGPEKGQPSTHAWRVSAGELAFQFTNEGTASCAVLFENGTRRVENSAEGFSAEELIGGWTDLSLENFTSLGIPQKGRPIFSAAELETLKTARRFLRKQFPRQPFAFAPIRTEPKRTYDPIGVQPEPEGSHVPMLLAQLARSADKDQWNELRSALKDYGFASGLFGDIEVVQKGKKESDPFQVGIRSGGPAFNLVDVGYGVSQALPILVDTLLRSSPDQDFLLQQPEVHLHPRAQAELGTFFARQADQRRRFLIETHSDYLVDRIRMEVRRGTHLSAEDVSILYFERSEQGATIHNLELDRHGSIKNPPPGFRQFFLDEERELLEI